jgi:hypothetical protein
MEITIITTSPITIEVPQMIKMKKESSSPPFRI